MNSHVLILGFPLWLSREKSACNAGDTGDSGSIPWIGKIPWRRKWQPTSVFLDRGAWRAIVHDIWTLSLRELDRTEAPEHVY